VRKDGISGEHVAHFLDGEALQHGVLCRGDGVEDAVVDALEGPCGAD
jgi:hypothetical protein